jgi:hypothetical protein
MRFSNIWMSIKSSFAKFGDRITFALLKCMEPPPLPIITLEEQLDTHISELNLSNCHYLTRNTRDIIAIELCDYYERFNPDRRLAFDNATTVYNCIDSLFSYTTTHFISRLERDSMRVYLMDYKEKLASASANDGGMALTDILNTSTPTTDARIQSLLSTHKRIGV